MMVVVTTPTGGGLPTTTTGITRGVSATFLPMRWALLFLLGVTCVIFYEDVGELRVAARHAVLGEAAARKSAHAPVTVTVQERNRAIAAERVKREHFAASSSDVQHQKQPPDEEAAEEEEVEEEVAMEAGAEAGADDTLIGGESPTPEGESSSAIVPDGGIWTAEVASVFRQMQREERGLDDDDHDDDKKGGVYGAAGGRWRKTPAKSCPGDPAPCGGPDVGVCNAELGECRCSTGWTGAACGEPDVWPCNDPVADTRIPMRSRCAGVCDTTGGDRGKGGKGGRGEGGEDTTTTTTTHRGLLGFALISLQPARRLASLHCISSLLWAPR